MTAYVFNAKTHEKLMVFVNSTVEIESEDPESVASNNNKSGKLWLQIHNKATSEQTLKTQRQIAMRRLFNDDNDIRKAIFKYTPPNGTEPYHTHRISSTTNDDDCDAFYPPENCDYKHANARA